MAGETEVIDVRLTGPVKVEGEAWSDVEAVNHPPEPVAGGRSLAFVVDKPAAYGGGDEGMMPSEYLLAAVGSCMLLTLRKVAEKRRVDHAQLAGRVKAVFEGGDIARIEGEFMVRSGADQDAWDTILRLAAKTCTISRSLAIPMEKTIRVISTTSE